LIDPFKLAVGDFHNQQSYLILMVEVARVSPWAENRFFISKFLEFREYGI